MAPANAAGWRGFPSAALRPAAAIRGPLGARLAEHSREGCVCPPQRTEGLGLPTGLTRDRENRMYSLFYIIGVVVVALVIINLIA